MAEWIIEIKDGKFPIGKWTELVRCRDCKYNYANKIPGGKGCQQNVYIEVDDNFFCADGERKDENHEV